MPLSQEITKQSFDVLTDRYSSNLSDRDIECFRAVNLLASADNVALHFQSTDITDLVMELVKNHEVILSIEQAAAAIYAQVKVKMDEESAVNQRQHNAQGRFDFNHLHRRDPRDQMQDHDMTRLLPKSYGDIEVFAVVNRFDPATALFQEAIFHALGNKAVNHLIIAVGPGHWRGVYLTKPIEDDDRYQLEIFDPYGPRGAETICEFILDLLDKSGVKEEQINIKFTGPVHKQKDSYACGDYTCAQSHRKMKQWGADPEAYNSFLIEALEVMGNKKNALRRVSRLVSSELAGALLQQQDAAPHEKSKNEKASELEERDEKLGASLTP